MFISCYHNNYTALDHTLDFSKNYTRQIILFFHFPKTEENIIVHDQYKVHYRLVGTNSFPLEHRTNYNVFDTHDRDVFLLRDSYQNYSYFQDLFACISTRYKNYYIVCDQNYFSMHQHNFIKEGD